MPANHILGETLSADSTASVRSGPASGRSPTLPPPVVCNTNCRTARRGKIWVGRNKKIGFFKEMVREVSQRFQSPRVTEQDEHMAKCINGIPSREERESGQS
jgi:hypothetical protein